LSLLLACRGSWKWKDNKPPHSKETMTTQTNGGLAICLSACEDGQMAADTAVRILDKYFHLPSLWCNAMQ